MGERKEWCHIFLNFPKRWNISALLLQKINKLSRGSDVDHELVDLMIYQRTYVHKYLQPFKKINSLRPCMNSFEAIGSVGYGYWTHRPTSSSVPRSWSKNNGGRCLRWPIGTVATGRHIATGSGQSWRSRGGTWPVGSTPPGSSNIWGLKSWNELMGGGVPFVSRQVDQIKYMCLGRDRMANARTRTMTKRMTRFRLSKASFVRGFIDWICTDSSKINVSPTNPIGLPLVNNDVVVAFRSKVLLTTEFVLVVPSKTIPIVI